jgi:hypothetical protein
MSAAKFSLFSAPHPLLAALAPLPLLAALGAYSLYQLRPYAKTTVERTVTSCFGSTRVSTTSVRTWRCPPLRQWGLTIGTPPTWNGCGPNGGEVAKTWQFGPLEIEEGHGQWSIPIEDTYLSPDKRLEAYTILVGTPEGSVPRLYVSPVGKPTRGILVLQTNRSMEVRWTPDSRYLIVEDHWGCDAGDVYAYRIDPAQLQTIPPKDNRITHIDTDSGSGTGPLPLAARSPQMGKDTTAIWVVKRWDEKRRELSLRDRWRLSRAQYTLSLPTAP